MTKPILDINLDNKVKFDIFSQAEENLYIDMLIKTDEKMREKASDYAGYLEDLKMYLEFENEEELNQIIDFLKSKNEIDATEEEKREYMEMKFDVLDGKIKIDKSYDDDSDDFYILKDNNDDKNIKSLKEKISKFFPILNNLNNIFFKHYYEILKIVTYDEKLESSIPDNYENETEKNEAEWEYNNKKQVYEKGLNESYINFNFNNPEIKEYKDLENKKYLLVPLIIPYGKSVLIPEYAKNLDTSYVIWKIKRLKIKNIKHDKEKENNLDLLNKFIFLEENLNYEDEFISKIFPKTNLYCDYRFFDRSFFE